jgi:hypothetical protein
MVLTLADEVQIFSVEQDCRNGLIVTFSDETAGTHVVEELPELKPYREVAYKQRKQSPPQAEIQDSLDGARKMRRWDVHSELL